MEVLTYIPFPKQITATVAVTTREVAYGVILPAWGEFPVLKSDNAWWMDTRKVTLLFDAYKVGATDESACINADITLGQLRYFREMHPDFSQAKEACKSAPLGKYLNALHSKGSSDLPTIRWYLSKMHPDFKPKEPVVPSPVVQQTVNVAGDAAVVNNVDTTKIEKILERAAERFFAHDTGEGVDVGGSGQGVATHSA